MFVAIIGSRSFNNYEYLRYKCDLILSNSKDITIISGGAIGTDRLAERYARERNLPIMVLKAKWSTLGKSAGMIRNRDMLELCTHVIAFWDFHSPGTSHMIQNAHHLNRLVRVININFKPARQINLPSKEDCQNKSAGQR